MDVTCRCHVRRVGGQFQGPAFSGDGAPSREVESSGVSRWGQQATVRLCTVATELHAPGED